MSSEGSKIISRRLVVGIAAIFVLAAIGVGGYFVREHILAHRLVTLRVGHLPVPGHAKFFVAQQEGFFRDEGLNVQLIEFTNSADGLAALRAGKLDLGAFGTTAPLVHISKGADISIIGGVMGEDAAIIARPEDAGAIHSVADLKGKKVATVRLATGDAVFRGALNAAGINWKSDLQIFELKSPAAVLEAVKSGQVYAGVIWGPYDLRAEEQGLKVVIRSGDLQPGHPCCRLTVHTKDAQARRDVWVHFVRAELRAEKFTFENHPKTIDDIAKYLKLDRGLIEHAYYSGHLDQASDPNLTGVELFWNTMLKSGFIESKEDISTHVRLDIYKQALDELAHQYPNDPFWQKREQLFAQRDKL
jgi:NitT/TauT family transport system substrate-binding protein